jgi:hypothetical protein
MPNIIASIYTEMARVRALLPRLDEADRAEAERMLRFAEISVAKNSLEEMQDSLSDLTEFGRTKEKPEQEK